MVREFLMEGISGRELSSGIPDRGPRITKGMCWAVSWAMILYNCLINKFVKEINPKDGFLLTDYGDPREKQVL